MILKLIISGIFGGLMETAASNLTTGNKLFGFLRFEIATGTYHLDEDCRTLLRVSPDECFSWETVAQKTIDPTPILMFQERLTVAKKNSFTLEFDQSPQYIAVSSLYDERLEEVTCYIEEIHNQLRNPYSNIMEPELTQKVETVTRSAVFEWMLTEKDMRCSDNFFKITQLEGHNRNNFLDVDTFFDLIEDEKQNFVLDVMHESIVNNQEFEVSFFTRNQSRKLKLFGYPEGDYRSKKVLGFIADITQQHEFEESIIKGQDLERKRLSMELHDGVGQRLVAIKYLIAKLKITRDLSELDTVNQSMNEAIEEIRSITHNLSTEIVEELGLGPALQQLLEKCASALEASREFSYQVPVDKLTNEDTKKIIYRIVQETLSNSMKYSKADHLTLAATYQNKQLLLDISDNGQGFEVTKQQGVGIGLKNIRQRVTFLNGHIKITSNSTEGTRVKIKIPT